MNTKKQDIPVDVLAELTAIGGYLQALATNQKLNHKELSKRSNLSPITVRSILTGKTCNIASYMILAKTLGYSLTGICNDLVMRSTQTLQQVASTSA